MNSSKLQLLNWIFLFSQKVIIRGDYLSRSNPIRRDEAAYLIKRIDLFQIREDLLMFRAGGKGTTIPRNECGNSDNCVERVG